MCKSFAPYSRQITIPVSHHSVFYRPDALPVDQQTSSKHWSSVVVLQCKYCILLSVLARVKLVSGCAVMFQFTWMSLSAPGQSHMWHNTISAQLSNISSKWAGWFWQLLYGCLCGIFVLTEWHVQFFVWCSIGIVIGYCQMSSWLFCFLVVTRHISSLSCQSLCM